MSKNRLLIVGCGGISNAWIKSLIEIGETNIVGLVDINIDNAKEKREQYALACEVFTDLETGIDTLKPDIVIDVTIPEVHYQVTTTALNKGCHVFGEKPLSDSMETALKMVAAAKLNNRSYSIMQNRRFNKEIRSFKRIIEDKEIGILGLLSASFFLGPVFGGFREAMESPLILDMAIHTFDEARFISGADPLSVYCYEYNPAGSWYNGDASAVCIFEMSNGVTFTYNGSWCAKGDWTSWDADWRARGSKGTAGWDGTHLPWVETPLPSEKDVFLSQGKLTKVPDYGIVMTSGHTSCIQEMFAALKEGRDAETDCKDNIKSLAMVMAAMKSSREGRKVMLSEIL